MFALDAGISLGQCHHTGHILPCVFKSIVATKSRLDIPFSVPLTAYCDILEVVRAQNSYED